MIYENLEFFNVDHLDYVPGMSGMRLERFPDHFRYKLGNEQNRNGRFRAERAHGCEIRFVTEAKYFDVALSAVEEDMNICVYYGDMLHEVHRLKAGICTVLHVEQPEMYKFVEAEKLIGKRFAPYVWRIQFGMNGFAYFHYVDTFGQSIRPPKETEKPSISWVAYGSSITCGSVTSLYSNCYIEQTALRLGAEVMNKGLSGSCFCEPMAVDYMASVEARMVSLEVGVNMIQMFDEEEFEARISYLLKRMKESMAERIYVIDMFPNKGLLLKDHQEPYYQRYRSFRKIWKEKMEKVEDKRFVHIDGEAVAKDFSYLSTDLLHPSDHGHILMGENLAAIIKAEEEERGGNIFGTL